MSFVKSFSNSCVQLINSGNLITRKDKHGYSNLELLEKLVHYKYSNYNDKQAFAARAGMRALRKGGSMLGAGAAMGAFSAMGDDGSGDSFLQRWGDRMKRPSTWAAAATVPIASSITRRVGPKLFGAMAKSKGPISRGMGKAFTGQVSTGRFGEWASKGIKRGAKRIGNATGSGFFNRIAQGSGGRGMTGKVVGAVTNPFGFLSGTTMALGAAGLPSMGSLYDTDKGLYKRLDDSFAGRRTGSAADAHRSMFRAR